MSTTTTDGVHRLVDMVVEEVSLVDRAANLRRFLIVKRDDSMDTEETKKVDVPEDSPLGMALAALESLTDIVELLGDDDSDPRITALAEQLRTTGEQLLTQAGLSEAEDGDETEKTKSIAENLSAAKAAAARLRRGKKPAPKEDAEDKAPKEDDTKKVDLAPVTEGLAKLTESFKALSESVTAQAQRLGRVEKQFGMPNSIPQQPKPPKPTEEVVAWPLDLNNPLDRESVDKSLSFHES
jgi:uncharacterized phage infection (PIP) family protein YhgE